MAKSKTSTWGIMPKPRNQFGQILYAIKLDNDGLPRRVAPQQLPTAKSSHKQNQRRGYK